MSKFWDIKKKLGAWVGDSEPKKSDHHLAMAASRANLFRGFKSSQFYLNQFEPLWQSLWVRAVSEMKAGHKGSTLDGLERLRDEIDRLIHEGDKAQQELNERNHKKQQEDTNG